MQQEMQKQVHVVKQRIHTTCCIVGSGPAGMVLALLLVRKGVPVTLLEAHMDFDREFRGDTLHPSVMEMLDQLGLAERLLQLPHTKMPTLDFEVAGGTFTFAHFDELKTKYPYITVIAQARFLAFLADEMQRYPHFKLLMGAQVDQLLEEDGRVCGVSYRGPDGRYEVRAPLTVGADGRFSRLRKLAGFEPINTSPPMDILWFRLARKADDPRGVFGRFGQRRIIALIDRQEYWQIGYVIPKGSYQRVRAQGIASLRQAIAESIPFLAERVDELVDWKQVAVLSVESNRLPRWYRPGLLLIGDAAHVMSPIGGVGINYAIQDAVVAANVLSAKLRKGEVQTRDLAKVQRRRELAVRLIQKFQVVVQNMVFVKTLQGDGTFQVPLFLRLLDRIPKLRTLPARVIGFGVIPVRFYT